MRDHDRVRPLGHVDRVILERIVWLLALMLLRTNQEEELSLRTRGNFMVDIAEERLSAAEAPAEARSLDFDYQGELVPAAIRSSAPSQPVRTGRRSRRAPPTATRRGSAAGGRAA